MGKKNSRSVSLSPKTDLGSVIFKTWTGSSESFSRIFLKTVSELVIPLGACQIYDIGKVSIASWKAFRRSRRFKLLFGEH